jgi:hypothetical protein
LSKYITEPGYTIEDVFKKVNVDVKEKYPSQIPWTNSSLGGDFYFIATTIKHPKGNPGDSNQQETANTVPLNNQQKSVEDSISWSKENTMCTARCFAKGIIGVEVSFVDPRNNKKYTKVSRGEDLEFEVPCYLLEQPIDVNFKRDQKREPRNVQNLKDFEIPDLFK